MIHDLVKKFNDNLAEIETNSKQSIEEVQGDVHSIRENICEMLNEVPQLTMSSLETRFSNIEERLSTTIETTSVNSSLNDAYYPTNNRSMLSATTTGTESTKSHEEFMLEVANEVDDRQKRRKTLVIHNIEENDNDVDDYRQVTNILNEIIDSDHPLEQQDLKIYRLGRRTSGKKRTVKVHLKSEDLCRNVLQQTIKLRTSNQFKHVVLQPDLTPIQRHRLKVLVEEKKQRNCYAVQCNEEPDWIIRRGKICRRRDLEFFK